MTTSGWTDAQQTIVNQKCGFACQWLWNLDMHVYAKCDQNISCGSRVMTIFTNWPRMDGHTNSDYRADQRVVQSFLTKKADWDIRLYPDIQFMLPCNPRTIFHGCQIVYWDPWKRNKVVLKNILVWAMWKCMVSMATHSGFGNGVCQQNYSYLSCYWY